MGMASGEAPYPAKGYFFMGAEKKPLVPYRYGVCMRRFWAYQYPRSIWLRI
jgi:hypothetical protein